MRRPPKFLRVLGQRIGVAVIEDLLHDDEETGHGHPAYGVFSPQEPIIWLNKDNGPERQKVTAVHEALHAMLNTARLDIEDEEDTVTRLAPLVLDFIRANRGAILWLQES